MIKFAASLVARDKSLRSASSKTLEVVNTKSFHPGRHDIIEIVHCFRLQDMLHAMINKSSDLLKRRTTSGAAINTVEV
ncbi:hypothetical protein EG327_000215 [Venturia inaequalis]|uniref:Uncharacterized protein n=1 Tax=Venturia inaequalis TaxID=5025 RepID=A0A8H3Z9L2_VENIN|nr:hypothetical protein EG327_000215 [Venturia inaequalis]